jgi:type III pantothenate kinase
MQLLVDIGNTSIAAGLEEKGKIKKIDKIQTRKDKGASHYKRAFNKYFRDNKIKKQNIDLVLFLSVVPSLNTAFKKALGGLISCQIIEVGKDMKFLINNRYRKPSEVGADRLANAVAASFLYRNKDIIIVDFGTAVTFDVVSKRGEYLGGLITPGIITSLENLYKKGELLPRVSIKKPVGLIGRDTVSSINNGIIYAAASSCDGIVKRLKKSLSGEAKVIATGGHARLIKNYTASIDKVYPYLTLKGLTINYLMSRKNTKR